MAKVMEKNNESQNTEEANELMEQAKNLAPINLEGDIGLTPDISTLSGEEEEKPKVNIPTLSKIKAGGGIKSKDKKTVAVYPYVDENGEVLYEILRRVGSGQKFLTRSYDDEGNEQYKLNSNKKLVPYNLPNVLKAIEEGTTIWIVEGESKADTLNRLGFVATTCAYTGSDKWSNYYSEFLMGAKAVIVMADNDLEGETFAENVCSSLEETLEDTEVSTPLLLRETYPKLKLGGDIDDLIEAIGEDTTKATLESIEANFLSNEN